MGQIISLWSCQTGKLIFGQNRAGIFDENFEFSDFEISTPERGVGGDQKNSEWKIFEKIF